MEYTLLPGFFVTEYTPSYYGEPFSPWWVPLNPVTILHSKVDFSWHSYFD